MVYLQTISALALVLGLIGFLYWAGQRFGARLQGNAGSRIQIRERLALGDKKWLLVVRADDRELLIGSTPTSFTLISELEPLSSSPEGGEGGTSFNQPVQPSFKSLLEKLR
ncbi:MAG TPA: flagellar biosynthetic protein FliO [Acidobacteriota bacterium]|nr:flagellar biosynthetic protein FliO [Acidobacteriota bacterium]